MTDVFSQPNGEAKADPAKVSLQDLVGEGKKFKDADALAAAKAESDAFIEQLKAENAGLRNAGANLEALQARIAELEAEKNKSPAPSPNTSGELSQDKLEAIVAGVITKQEQSRTANQNVAAANDTLVKLYGDKATSVLSERAAAVGMSVTDLKAVAAKSPSAFYSIIGVDPKTSTAKPDMQTSNLNTVAIPSNPAQPKVGSRAYYEVMRKTMGNDKFFGDVKLQKQIFEHKKSGAYDAR